MPHPSTSLYPGADLLPGETDEALADVLRGDPSTLLDALAPFVASAHEVQATVGALAREVARIEAAIQTQVDNYFPSTADAYLKLQEELLDLPVDPSYKTLAQRRAAAGAYWRGIRSAGRGSTWEDAMDKLLGAGQWSYEEYDPDVSGSPNVIVVYLPGQASLGPPSGLGATPGSGGSLASATYYYAVTGTNAYGETPPSAVVSATVAASGKVTLAWDDLAGASGYGVYRGTSATTLKLIAVAATSDLVDSGLAAGPETPPVADTTQSIPSAEARKLTERFTPAHVEVDFIFLDEGFIIGVSEIGVQPL